MTRKELDKLISEKLLGMVPCRGYRSVWYKEQGAALIKQCSHPDNTCYSEVELVTFMGRMGGPPQYCGSSRAALVLLKELEKRAEVIVVHYERGLGWMTAAHNFKNLDEVKAGSTFTAHYGPCLAPVPEMAIALLGAAMAGVQLSAEEIVD